MNQALMLDTEAFAGLGTTAMEAALTLEGFTVLWTETPKLLLCKSNRRILSPSGSKLSHSPRRCITELTLHFPSPVIHQSPAQSFKNKQATSGKKKKDVKRTSYFFMSMLL